MSTFSVPPKRDQQIKFLASKEERAELDRIAAKLDVPLADLIRLALNDYIGKLKKARKI